MPKSVQEAPWAPLGPQSPSRAKKSCFLGTLWRSQNGTWSLPRTRWRGLGRPAASPKPPRGHTKAPKLAKQTAREQKMRCFQKVIFHRPCRGAEHSGPPQNHAKAAQIGFLDPLGGSGGRLWSLGSASGATQESKNQARREKGKT